LLSRVDEAATRALVQIMRLCFFLLACKPHGRIFDSDSAAHTYLTPSGFIGVEMGARAWECQHKNKIAFLFSYVRSFS
jgi:hypothetical protein